ncbi:MAG: hypothetical protein QHI48_00325 [Bacteroidota bacterium]|nr:hypothetical protein [Bacteroidota bacterium]
MKSLPFHSMWTILFILAMQVPITQCQQRKSVHAGPQGIWVDLGEYVLPARIEGNACQFYIVERKAIGENRWETVAKVQGPTSQHEFEKAVQAQTYRFPELRTLTIQYSEIWKSLEKKRTISSIGFLGQSLPIQAALGTRWYDTTAEKGKVYHYQVSRVAEDGMTTDRVTSEPISYPQPAATPRLLVYRHYSDASAVNVVWTPGKQKNIGSFKIYRREGVSGPFEHLPVNVKDTCCIVSAGFMSRGDSLFCTIIDRTIKTGTVYQYYIKPMDIFQNAGMESDTATVYSFDMIHVPLPQQFHIRSIDSVGIQIRWTLYDTSAVHGVIIERSRDFDTGYVELFTASPRDTAFTDITVTPMERYYYRLKIVGPGGIVSGQSAKIMGHFRSNIEPTPPEGIRAEGIHGGIRVSWFSDTEQLLEGYYVYRSEGLIDTMVQISTLLPPGTTQFLDTLGMQAGRIYAYCLRSVSSSHIPSVPSDTVTAQPIIPMGVSTPMGLAAYADEHAIHLTWQGQKERDPSLDGFRVYRREGTSRWKTLNSTLLPPQQNFFDDNTAEPGKKYFYAVQAYSVEGDSSSWSMIASTIIPLPRLYPPGNLTAKVEKNNIRLSWDEIVQPNATGFKVYKYTRGSKPHPIATLPLTQREYVDMNPGSGSPIFYFVTTIGKYDTESAGGNEISIRRMP